MSEKDDPLSLAKSLAESGSEVIMEILSLGLQAKRARDGGVKKGSKSTPSHFPTHSGPLYKKKPGAGE